MKMASPMAVMLAGLMIMTDCAGFERAIRFGRPKSRIAVSALKKGMRPPNGRAQAMRRRGDVEEVGEGHGRYEEYEGGIDSLSVRRLMKRVYIW